MFSNCSSGGHLNRLGKFGRGSYKKHLVEIVLNLDQKLSSSCRVKIFFDTCFVFSKKNYFNLRIFYFLALTGSYSTMANSLGNFGRRPYGECSGEIILKLDKQFRRRRFKNFLKLCSGCQFCSAEQNRFGNFAVAK